jgi:4-amino-4-deoxy-L-arabinose transferase-like glycosyltransferase
MKGVHRRPFGKDFMSESPAHSNQPSSRAPQKIFWIALLVRVAYITLAHTYRFPALDNHFHYGFEMGKIAQALATGYGYADPFNGHTGPTAWVTPLYPLILADVFKVFGVYSDLSAWVILCFNSLCNALIVPLVWETGARCFNLRVARWSAWIWALYPAAMQYATRWVWETALTAFLFQLALLLALRIGRVGDRPGDGPTWQRWLAFGLVWGLIGLSNPGLLLFLPVCGLWMLARGGRAWAHQLPKAVCAGLVFIAVITPWSLRNQRAFHAFVPLRTNFGVELYLGNGPGATGALMSFDHPVVNSAQLELYRQMGELRYSEWRGAQARQAIRANLPRFFQLCVTRIYFFWSSIPNAGDHPLGDLGRALNYAFTSLAALLGLVLALRKRIPASGLIAAAFLLLPLVYYAVAATARFRHPLEPLMTVLGVFLFQQADLRRGFSVPILRHLWAAKPKNIGCRRKLKLRTAVE